MLALISNGEVVETRDIALDDVPPHKRDNWRPIVGDAPDYNKATHTRTGPTYQIEPDRVLRVWQLTPRDLGEVKASAKARVDYEAGQVRLRYITDAPGQDMTYDRKRREALEALDNPNPTAERYPVLAASIGIEVPSSGDAKADFDAIASLVIAKEVQWAQSAAVLEAKRLGAKAAIEAAQTVEAAQAAAQVVWP